MKVVHLEANQVKTLTMRKFEDCFYLLLGLALLFDLFSLVLAEVVTGPSFKWLELLLPLVQP